MINFLHHLFIPHYSNNHRSKLLHHKSLFSIILVLFILFNTTIMLRKTAPSILGVATNINVSDLLSITNQKRGEQGLPTLVLNDTLSSAAAAKAANMFAKNYWAHNAPDGTTPWVFFMHAGYNYLYAGENLAKDFNDSSGVINAWMASPSHRENMLSNRYQDIGFAVVNGTLNGSETTLVVEMFGKRQQSVVAASVPVTAASQIRVEEPLSGQPTPTPAFVLPPVQVVPVTSSDQNLIAGARNAPLIDSESVTKRISISILAVFILAFVLDMVYIERRKLVRLVGHNVDHIIFLTGAIVLLLMFGKGLII